MSTSYYMVETAPTEVYRAVKVMRKSNAGDTFMCPTAREGQLMTKDESGTYQWECDYYAGDMTVPARFSDLSMMLGSGRYVLVDEYGELRDLKEVLHERPC